jgi:hypothetical protein
VCVYARVCVLCGLGVVFCSLVNVLCSSVARLLCVRGAVLYDRRTFFFFFFFFVNDAIHDDHCTIAVGLL